MTLPADPASPPQGQGPRPQHHDIERDAALVARMLELGDGRLLADEGPPGGQLPKLSPEEWGKVYRACQRIVRDVKGHPQGPRPALAGMAAELEALGAKATEGPWEASQPASIPPYDDEHEHWKRIVGPRGRHVAYVARGFSGDGPWESDWTVTHEANASLIAALRNALPEILTAIDRAAKLEAFKAYVHQRLDEAGIPTHPDGPHSKEGCRVGDRLDIALAGLAARGDGTPQAQWQWVPVGERMPEDYRTVIVWMDYTNHGGGKGPRTAYYSPTDRDWRSASGPIDHVTHWQPMPEGPDGALPVVSEAGRTGDGR